MSVQVAKLSSISSLLYGFNTSYVSVQDLKAKLFVDEFSVSIHPMCRFKNISATSTRVNECFNTSYVSVQGEHLNKEYLNNRDVAK